MLTLIFCIVLNALIGVIFKLFEKFKVDNVQAIVVNYIVCVLTAAVVSKGNPFPDGLTNQPWFWTAVGLGGLFILVFNLIALTVQYAGIMVATIFQKMSLVAPSILAILIYHESSGVFKWLGILLSVLAIFMISYSNEQEKTKTSKVNKKWLYPLLTFLGSCLIDSSLFLVEKNNLVSEGDVGFVAGLFLFAAICGVIILVIKMMRKELVLRQKNIIGGVILGIPNFFSIYLLLLALQQGWEGSVVFPINNVGVLVLAAFFGILFFKESLNAYKIAGFVMSLIAIILIAFA